MKHINNPITEYHVSFLMNMKVNIAVDDMPTCYVNCDEYFISGLNVFHCFIVRDS